MKDNKYHEYEVSVLEAGDELRDWIRNKHYIADTFFLQGSMSLEEATRAYKQAHQEYKKASAKYKKIKDARP